MKQGQFGLGLLRRHHHDLGHVNVVGLRQSVDDGVRNIDALQRLHSLHPLEVLENVIVGNGVEQFRGHRAGLDGGNSNPHRGRELASQSFGDGSKAELGAAVNRPTREQPTTRHTRYINDVP